ncbi:MAG: 50S ribosomal protein L21 [Patescibacteria group bacterium]
MDKLAVIKTGGKQYIVSDGQELKVEKLPYNEGENFVFNEILMLSSKNGENLLVGKPFIKDVKIEAELIEQGRGKKIHAAKYKNKTRYYKAYGHRQSFSKVKIKKIV